RRSPPPLPTLFPYTTLFRSSSGGRQLRLLVDRHHGGAAEAEVVLEGGRGPIHLAVAGLAPELPCELCALGQAGGSQRVALGDQADRKSTRLNSSHRTISYAV